MNPTELKQYAKYIQKLFQGVGRGVPVRTFPANGIIYVQTQYKGGLNYYPNLFVGRFVIHTEDIIAGIIEQPLIDINGDIKNSAYSYENINFSKATNEEFFAFFYFYVPPESAQKILFEGYKVPAEVLVQGS